MQAAVCAFEGTAFHPEDLLQPRDVAEAIAGALALPATAEVTDLVIRPARKPIQKEGKP
jgi:NADP-dependent 3-hydroxy acid dehydrogenase YdfG